MKHYEFIEGKHYKADSNGCWLWLRTKLPTGYPQVHVQEKDKPATRK